MKMNKIFSCCVALSFLLLGYAAAPAQNSRARQFYETAVKEKDVEKRIAALNKAVEVDPNFAEALYNLALAHKEKQDYGRAEQYLLRAKETKAGGDLKVAILYELAAAYNRQGKTKNFEETLRLAKGQATDAQRGATIAFELGRFFYQQGRYEEALLELQEGQRLYPDRRDYFANLIQLTQTAQATQQLVAAADRAAAQGKLEEAKALLLESKQKNPAAKNVDAKIAELEARLAAAAGARSRAALYAQAQKLEAENKPEAAIASYEKLLQAGDYQDASVRLQKLRGQLAQKQQSEELEAEYRRGMEALKIRDWTGATAAFEKILAQNSSFRDAAQRLAQAQAGLERENTDALAARYYADGVAAMGRNDAAAALTAFEKIRRLDPAYRDVATLISAIEKKLQPATGVTHEMPAANPDSLYASALTFFNKKDWPQAVASLEKLPPHYRDVVDRLAEARAYLSLAPATTAGVAAHASTEAEPRAVEAPANDRTFFYFGGFVALLVLPVIGFFALSPSGRAQLHLLRGNYAAAAQVYEKALARHPERIKLYPPLGRIYLVLGRRDGQAIKIYKMILQLQLDVERHAEINTIVAQNFLTEGRTDADAIHVLEQALKVELRNRK